MVVYKNVLSFCLRKPAWVITVSLLVFAVSFWMSKEVPRGEHSGLGTFSVYILIFLAICLYRERHFPKGT